MERIIIEGNFDPTRSYGIVNFNLATSLIDLGRNITVIPLDMDSESLVQLLYLKSSKIKIANHGDKCTIRIRQLWPPNWKKKHPEEKLIVIQPWEYGSIPAAWLNGVKQVDQVWVPSLYAKSCYVQSGINPDKVYVVPNGISEEALNFGAKKLSQPRSPKTDGLFSLLFLGGPIYRKGADILIDSLKRLSPAERSSLKLVIKQVGTNGAYGGQDIIGSRLAESPELFEMIHLVDRYLSEEEIWSLIQNADSLIHPYRGEGFGMPVLEAMALGTPVIHTANGATNEFCTPEVSVLIKSNVVVEETPMIGEDLLADRLWYRESTPDDVAETIRAVIENRSELVTMAENAFEIAKGYSWPKVAEIANSALIALERNEGPDDRLTRISRSINNFDATHFDDDATTVATVQELVNIRDFHSAELLLDLLPVPLSNPMSILKEQLNAIAKDTVDLWSRSIHRQTLNSKIYKHEFAHKKVGNKTSSSNSERLTTHLSEYLTDRNRVLIIGDQIDLVTKVFNVKEISIFDSIDTDEITTSKDHNEQNRFSHFIHQKISNIELDRLDGVFVFNLFERLAPVQVELLLEELHQRTVTGCTLLILTPNFSDPSVALNSFWLEPSNVRPYPISLLKLMMLKSGFAPIEGACRTLNEISQAHNIATGIKI